MITKLVTWLLIFFNVKHYARKKKKENYSRGILNQKMSRRL